MHQDVNSNIVAVVSNTPILTEKNEPSVNRLHVATVRSCHAPPCPLEWNLLSCLSALPMAMTSPTPGMHLTPRTGSKP